MTSTFGRADLLRAYLLGGDAALRDVAERLGLEDDTAPVVQGEQATVGPFESVATSSVARDHAAFDVEEDVSLEVDALQPAAQFIKLHILSSSFFYQLIFVLNIKNLVIYMWPYSLA